MIITHFLLWYFSILTSNSFSLTGILILNLCPQLDHCGFFLKSVGVWLNKRKNARLKASGLSKPAESAMSIILSSLKYANLKDAQRSRESNMYRCGLTPTIDLNTL